MVFCVIIWENINSTSGKSELSKADKAVPTKPLKTLTEQQLEEFLCHLEEKKELLFFGFDKMSSTQKEKAKAEKARIEKMIRKVEDTIGECYVRG